MIDYINVRSSGTTVARQYLADDAQTAVDHADFIQLIPSSAIVARPQYALWQLDDVDVHECALYSNRGMHGITGFDGIFAGINVDRVSFALSSAHYVSFNGLLCGSFNRLYGINGAQVSVRLGNARVGGVPSVGRQLHYCNILHMQDAQYAYQPVQHDGTARIVDTRGQLTMRSGISTSVLNMVNFNLSLYRKHIADESVIGTFKGMAVNEMCLAYQEMAAMYGDKYE